MEIRAFAESLLFESALGAKVRDPGPLSDARPGPALADCPLPARVPELRLSEERAPFPSDRELASREEARGRALHFFANHELLALELMALVLLRFPEAPSAFRRGLAAIIREEQEHLRLYLGRMRACGTEFGTQPVNDYFWRALHRVPDLSAFSAGMSLVFEQANLDHALFYERAFRRAGDGETAEVLARIYRDEVRHVRHGLRWFRRWDEALPLWEAWLRHLPEHLRPGHAKGRRFSASARRAAGLDEEFIARLRVEGAASSRPPALWRFGALCEEEIAHEVWVERLAADPEREGERGPPPSPATVRGAQEIDRDLEGVLLLIAHAKDAVWLRERPPLTHLERLERAGFALPEILTGDPGRALGPRSLSDLRPWGWSRGAAAELAGLRERLVVGPERPPVPEWRPGWRALSAKTRAHALAVEIHAAGCEEDPAGTEPPRGRICATQEEAEAAVAALSATGAASVVLKAPWSTAGRHRRQLHAGRWSADLRGFVRRVLESAGEVLVEPWHERRADFGLQLEARRPGEVRVLGLVRFLTNPKGQYLGSVVGPEMRGLSDPERRFLHEPVGGRPRIAFWTEAVRARLEALTAEHAYHGPLGVDLYLHATPSGPRLRPLVEINPRWTMGRIALALRRRVAQGLPAAWLHLPRWTLKEAGHPDLRALLDALGPAAACVHDDATDGPRLRAGALPTTAFEVSRVLDTLLVVGQTLPELARLLPAYASIAPGA